MKTVDEIEHIRCRPGMYIGYAGDGSQSRDGVYKLLVEIINNSVDEFHKGYGNQIIINVEESGFVSVRDFGRGIPFCLMRSKSENLPGWGKFEAEKNPPKTIKESIGLTGCGLVVVNALSSSFCISSFRRGTCYWVRYAYGRLVDTGRKGTDNADGTLVEFIPDETIFNGFKLHQEIISEKVNEYAFLNSGLYLCLNGNSVIHKNGLEDRLNALIGKNTLYKPVHIVGQDIEIAFTHVKSGPKYFESYVNWHHTIEGGTHESALKYSLKKNFDELCREKHPMSFYTAGLCCIFNINIFNPIFEDSSKEKLCSRYCSEGYSENGLLISRFIDDFCYTKLIPYLQAHGEIVKSIEERENIALSNY